LKFGFWTRLFSRKYDSVLWGNKTFKTTAFPHALNRQLVRRDLSSRFDQIRLIRNRVSHHEPILKYRLSNHHANIIEVMNWIDPTLSRANALVDRFSVVYHADYYKSLEKKLAAEMPTPKEEEAPTAEEATATQD
jgi:hypothetical protein